jgi:hypothetical protein
VTKKSSPRTIATGLLAACGLTLLTPLQQTATGLAVLGAVGLASPALAQVGVPGVGVVVKKKPGNAPIIVPSDANGNLLLTGLEPGEYEIKLIGAEQAITVPVGRDGRLAITAWQESDKPGARLWVEPARRGARGPGIDVPRSFAMIPPTPCASPPPGMPRNPACRGATANYIDVNSSSAEDIVRLAPRTGIEAARAIVAERERAGAFADPGDLANRMCPTQKIDFGLIPAMIGEARVIAQPGDPARGVFQCRGGKPSIGDFAVFGKQYRDHVTLLR